MNILAIFDINFKTNRLRLEDTLRHFGLRKIQNNAYIGKLDNVELTDLKKEIKSTVRIKDSVLIFPVCENCYSKKENLGREIKFSEDFYRVF